jgi:predicted RNA-binding Zn ribbon-like protein
VNEVSNADKPAARKFRFVARALCLDFCNSMGGKRGVRPREHLHSYGDFLTWSEQAGLIEPRRAEEYWQASARQPAEAANVLTRAITLREAIYRIFLAPRLGKSPSPQDLESLNVELSCSLHRLRVGRTEEGYCWQWHDEGVMLDSPLGPIARSAAELLTAGASRKNIGQCQGENCGWLFLDSSRNHSRCWCDMRDCGNLAKVRRHRLKARGRGKSKPN